LSQRAGIATGRIKNKSLTKLGSGNFPATLYQNCNALDYLQAQEAARNISHISEPAPSNSNTSLDSILASTGILSSDGSKRRKFTPAPVAAPPPNSKPMNKK
jgi:hypothetical protein